MTRRHYPFIKLVELLEIIAIVAKGIEELTPGEQAICLPGNFRTRRIDEAMILTH